MDEADVIFSEDLYGATYNPSAQFSSPEVKAVIDCIWQHRNSKAAEINKQYKATPAYLKLAKDYRDCIDKLTGQFEFMVQEVGSFQSIEYVFQDGKIGYQDMDGISFDIVYGYKTMFQYIY